MSDRPRKHKEMLEVLKPLIAHLDDGGYHYFIVVGKEGTCARYMKGTGIELMHMISDMAGKNPQVRFLLDEVNSVLKK